MNAPALPAPIQHVDPELLEQLQRRLVAEAADAGILDVAVTSVASPVGDLVLAATSEGLVRVAFEREGYDAVLQQLADQVSPRLLLAPQRLDPVAREIEEYFAGGRRSFDVRLDWRLSHGFRHDVLAQLCRIPYGTTRSYAQVAAAAGNAKAVRATGTACATNPLPIVVPCHRVVRSDGSVGAYRGGTAAKHLLLELEAAA